MMHRKRMINDIKKDSRNRFKYISSHNKSKYISNINKKHYLMGLKAKIKTATSYTLFMKETAKRVKTQRLEVQRQKNISQANTENKLV